MINYHNLSKFKFNNTSFYLSEYTKLKLFMSFCIIELQDKVPTHQTYSAVQLGSETSDPSIQWTLFRIV